MNFLNEFVYNKEKNKVYLVAFVHFVMVSFGLWSLVSDLIDIEEPTTTSDLVHVVIHYTVHFILIFCLFLGTYIDIPFFLFPWLGASFLTYSYMTSVTLISLQSRKLHDTFLYLMNFTYLAICWYSWYVVFSYLKAAYEKGKLCRNKRILE